MSTMKDHILDSLERFRVGETIPHDVAEYLHDVWEAGGKGPRDLEDLSVLAGDSWAALELCALADYLRHRTQQREALRRDLDALDDLIAGMVPRIATGQTTVADAAALESYLQRHCPSIRELRTSLEES